MPAMYPVNDQDVQALQSSYAYHPPTDNQKERYQALRDQALLLALTIKENTPSSREQSLSLTNLESAIMWANKAIACHE